MNIQTFASLAAAVCLSGSVLAQGTTTVPTAVTNADVISLHSVGFSEDFIISKIRASASGFSLQIADLVELKKAGLSEKVIKAMLDSSSPVAPALTAVNPVIAAPPAPSRIEANANAKDVCPAIAATLAATPGATLAEKIRAYKPGSYNDLSDDRLERLYRVEFACVSTLSPATMPPSTASPTLLTTPPIPMKGCIAVKDIGSKAVRNILLGGIAGALISKKQYEIVDAVGYPGKIGQKLHGDDLETLQTGGTRVVILDKQYTAQHLRAACQ